MVMDRVREVRGLCTECRGVPGSPRSAGGKGSAKKKLTKAERDKLKRDEEERLAMEAEEARIMAMEEERLQKIRMKEEEEEMRKQNNEERKIRKVLMESLDELVQKHKEFLSDMHLNNYKNDKWARYMRCDGSPDPSILGEINTYINLKLEDRSSEDIDSVLNSTKLELSLIAELDLKTKHSPEGYMTEALTDQYNETVEDLQKLIKMKLDMASHNILLCASENMHPETSNLQYHRDDPHLTLSIWGNLAKNPRTKNFEFAEIAFGFDIPKLLTQSDCAYRVLWTKYDHYSQYCKSFHPRVKPPKEVEEQEVKPEEEGENEEKEGEEGEEKLPEEKSSIDVLAQLRQLDSEEAVEEVVEEEEVIEDWPDPSTPEPVEWEDFEEYDDVIDLRSFGVVGGVFHFDLLTLPPQPKAVNAWVLTQLVSPPSLQVLEYTAENAGASSARDGSERDRRDEKPPIQITIRIPPDVMVVEEPMVARWDEDNNYWSTADWIPPDVMVVEEPMVARWDEDNKYWSTAGFTDIEFSEEFRTLKCATSRFGTMALLQDLHINMPFQSWEMRPRGHNHCLINIIAAIIELEIEVKENLCCLTQPKDKSETEHLIENWMTPDKLIRELQRSGINVFPNVDSSKYVSVQKKHPVVEDRMYFEMALTSTVMAYSWSKWNSEAGEEKFVFQGAECLNNQQPMEDEWSLYMFTKTKVQRLKMKEYDDQEEFSEEKHPDHTFTCDLYHLVQDSGSQKAKDIVDTADIIYTDCVCKLLSSIRFLTYA